MPEIEEEQVDVSISTRPMSGREGGVTTKNCDAETQESCWEQAVYAPLQSHGSQTVGSFQSLIEGQTLSFEFQLKDDLLKLVDVCSAFKDGGSAFTSRGASDAATDSVTSTVTGDESIVSMGSMKIDDRNTCAADDSPPLILDSFVIDWLNSSARLRDRYRRSVIDILSQKLTSGSLSTTHSPASANTAAAAKPTVRILEKCEGLPIVGMEAIVELGIKYPNTNFELLIIEDDESKDGAVRRFLRKMKCRKGLQVEKASFTTKIFKTEDVGAFEGVVDVVILDVADKIGLLQCGLTNLLSRLVSSGVIDLSFTRFVPSKIRILTEAVESHRLLSEARVRGGENYENETTLGFNVATSINLFRNQTHAGISDLSGEERRKNLKRASIDEASKVERDGLGSAINMECRTSLTECHHKRLTNTRTIMEFATKDLCGNDELTNRAKLKFVEAGELHALVHWFQLFSEKGEMILDSGAKISDGFASPWQRAAFLVEDRKLRAESGLELDVEMKLRNDRIIISIL